MYFLKCNEIFLSLFLHLQYEVRGSFFPTKIEYGQYCSEKKILFFQNRVSIQALFHQPRYAYFQFFRAGLSKVNHQVLGIQSHQFLDHQRRHASIPKASGKGVSQGMGGYGQIGPSAYQAKTSFHSRGRKRIRFSRSSPAKEEEGGGVGRARIQPLPQGFPGHGIQRDVPAFSVIAGPYQKPAFVCRQLKIIHLQGAEFHNAQTGV
jgi:hypothetical protein